MLQRNLSANGSSLNDRMILQYPVSSIYDRKINIQPSFFGLELTNDTDGITNMKSAKVFQNSRKKSLKFRCWPSIFEQNADLVGQFNRSRTLKWE